MLPATRDNMASEPLSLEDQCLLHLICHLEDYLPETLASLPLHLRQRLLLNLPAADVCQLENTAVSAGINMEDTWKKLTNKRASKSEHLVNYACGLILNGTRGANCHETAKKLLFSVKGCLGVTSWKRIQHPFAPIGTREGQCEYPTPHRHVRYFSGECQQIQMISHLVEKCQWTPTQLEFNCNECERTSLWEQRDEYTVLVGRFLSRVEELILCATGDVTQFFLEQLLGNPITILKRLNLRHIYSDGYATLAKFFSRGVDNDPLYSHLNIPYSGLSSIEIEYYYEDFDPYLQSVIHYQSALTSLSLQRMENFFTSCSLPIPSVSLVSMLGSLFPQPQFRELNLEKLSMNWEHLSVLVPPFLSASSEDNPKILKLSSMEFPKDGTPPEPVDITTSGGVNRLPQKALILNPWPFDWTKFFQWLSAYSYTSLLSSMTVQGWQTFNLVVPDNLTTTLQSLRLAGIKFGEEVSPYRVFINLFQSPHLKSVHLEWCSIGPDGLLPTLTQGLKGQVSLGSLEDLNLEGNDLGDSPESELQEFFDVIFSLPQLSNLQLNLSHNHLTIHHLALLHESWRRNAGRSGKRLKLFEIRYIPCRL